MLGLTCLSRGAAGCGDRLARGDQACDGLAATRVGQPEPANMPGRELGCSWELGDRHGDMTAADRGQPACVAPRSHEIAIGGGSLPCAASVAARNVSDVRSSAVPRAPQSRPYRRRAGVNSDGLVRKISGELLPWRRQHCADPTRGSQIARHCQVTGGPCGWHSPKTRA